MTDTPELRAAAVAGDRAAIEQLLAMHRDAVANYLRRRMSVAADAEDLTQDVMLRALRRLPHYEEQGHSFVAWLLTIAHNAWADYYKSARVRLSAADKVDLILRDVETTEPPPEEIATSHEQHRRWVPVIAEAISDLTPKQQRIIRARFLEGRSIKDTIEVLGDATEGSIKASTLRAMCRLRKDRRLQGIWAELSS